MAGWDRPLFSIEIPRYKGVVQLVCLNGLVGLAGQVQSRLIPFYQFNRGYLPNSLAAGIYYICHYQSSH
jgi:hypothetical protein